MIQKFELSAKDYLAYRVGALLYSPAVYKGLADKIATNAFDKLTSVAFCLEDSIRDDVLQLAEENLKITLHEIKSRNIEKLPLLFVRVRTPEHLAHVHALLQEEESVLTGYILPKFDLSNAIAYKNFFVEVNQGRKIPLYFMPILESKQIAEVCTRHDTLSSIKDILDTIKEYVLNIRVGGNDLCNLFGLRRSVDQTIYDIGVVRDVLMDILNVFSRDYVVSSPVWEYFGTDSTGAWANGLRTETRLDRLNGFIGKTAIHPSQIPIITESMAVSKQDYKDAKELINWSAEDLGVAKSVGGDRMNEVKIHINWAKKILGLANIYGIKDDKV